MMFCKLGAICIVDVHGYTYIKSWTFISIMHISINYINIMSRAMSYNKYYNHYDQNLLYINGVHDFYVSH